MAKKPTADPICRAPCPDPLRLAIQPPTSPGLHAHACMYKCSMLACHYVCNYVCVHICIGIYLPIIGADIE